MDIFQLKCNMYPSIYCAWCFICC